MMPLTPKQSDHQRVAANLKDALECLYDSLKFSDNYQIIDAMVGAMGKVRMAQIALRYSAMPLPEDDEL